MLTVTLTARDRELARTAGALGYATLEVLRQVVTPDTGRDTLRDRLRLLHRGGYLVQQRFVGVTGPLYLYGIGRRSLPSGSRPPWRPGIGQIEHTLAVGETLAGSVRRTFPRSPLRVDDWEGEGEIRGWSRPGAPWPDLRLHWTTGGAEGWWSVEVDMGNQSRTGWRRKLGRYLAEPGTSPILTLTPSEGRARTLARLGAEIGAVMWVTTLDAFRTQADPWVLDATQRRRSSLTEAADGGAN